MLDGHLAEIAVICGDVIRDRRLTLVPLAPYYAAEGDSHTSNVSFGMTEAEFYSAMVDASENIVTRNFGNSGDSSEIGRRRVGKECRSRWSPYH